MGFLPQLGPPSLRVEDEGPSGPSRLSTIFKWLWGAPSTMGTWIIDEAQGHPYAAFAAFYGLMRAMGVTVQSGHRGQLFTLGRARTQLEPGFRFLIPFVQVVRIVPSRHRTLELERQRVATLEGLVYRVHATLVWRIADVRKALVEIGDVEQGMRDALAISVWEVLHRLDRAELRVSAAIDEQLARAMERRIAAWGVVVERAGFQSIAPSPRTLAVVQLRERVRERRNAASLMAKGGAPTGAAIGLVGAPRFPRRRQRQALRREIASRTRQRVELLHRRVAASDAPFTGLRGRALDRARAEVALSAKKKARLAAERTVERLWG